MRRESHRLSSGIVEVNEACLTHFRNLPDGQWEPPFQALAPPALQAKSVQKVQMDHSNMVLPPFFQLTSLALFYRAAFLVLSVIITLISVGPQHEPGNLRRCPAHLFADVLDAGVLFCFQNDLVVHVPDDPLLPQRLHGVGQNVAADGLRDVFHQLRTVALDPLKLF